MKQRAGRRRLRNRKPEAKPEQPTSQKLRPFENPTDLHKFLSMITPFSKRRHDYVTLYRSKFTDADYQRLLKTLKTLYDQGVVGYRIWKNSISVRLKNRYEDTQNESSESRLRPEPKAEAGRSRQTRRNRA